MCARLGRWDKLANSFCRRRASHFISLRKHVHPIPPFLCYLLPPYIVCRTTGQKRNTWILNYYELTKLGYKNEAENLLKPYTCSKKIHSGRYYTLLFLLKYRCCREFSSSPYIKRKKTNSYRTHFVFRLSVCLSVRLSVRLSICILIDFISGWRYWVKIETIFK